MTSKQRAYLRSLANSIDPIFQIGKAGLSENLLKQLDDAIEARELIKINVFSVVTVSVCATMYSLLMRLILHTGEQRLW